MRRALVDLMQRESYRGYSEEGERDSGLKPNAIPL
jgi:hypothetical protein